jgi:hypothetical protein
MGSNSRVIVAAVAVAVVHTVTGAWACSNGGGHCEDDGYAGRIAWVVVLLLLL